MLHEADLIAGQRRGSWVYYRLLPERLSQIAPMAGLAEP